MTSNPNFNRCDGIFSQFDIALLKDTGWFSTIDGSQTPVTSFGKNLGCPWFSSAADCDSGRKEWMPSSNPTSMRFDRRGASNVECNASMKYIDFGSDCCMAQGSFARDC